MSNTKKIKNQKNHIVNPDYDPEFCKAMLANPKVQAAMNSLFKTIKERGLMGQFIKEMGPVLRNTQTYYNMTHNC